MRSSMKAKSSASSKRTSYMEVSSKTARTVACLPRHQDRASCMSCGTITLSPTLNFDAIALPLEEVGEVLEEHDALIQVDFAPGDLPLAVDPTQGVDSLPDEGALLILMAVAIEDEAALHAHLVLP